MKHIKAFYFVLMLALLGSSCKKYLDFVPDNMAVLDDAFSMRSAAEKYLFTCYSFMPITGNVDYNPAFTGGDEIMIPVEMQGVDVVANDFLAHNAQNIVNPYIDYWAGGGGVNGLKSLYRGISTCNIFLDNVHKVPDLYPDERMRWTAEVKFLKAYYHYWLLRSYGPIPLGKENIPITSEVDAFYLKRSPVDSCVGYIVSLLDEAAMDLPVRIDNTTAELGRITNPVALSLKAQVLVMAASPLFNGNTEFAGYKNKDGELLFNQTYDAAKWQKAAQACSDAIKACEAVGMKLYRYNSNEVTGLPQEYVTQMSLRNSVTEKWNPEIIWANTQSWTSGLNGLQANSQPKIDKDRASNFSFKGFLAPTLKMAELFYSENGVPVEEDKTWNGGDYSGRYDIQTAKGASDNSDKHRYYIKDDYTTSSLHFNREPRFYSSLGFDGGIWYGQGRFDPADANKPLFWVEAKTMQVAGGSSGERYSGTGYWPKKLVNAKNVIGVSNTYDVESYPWPEMRLADLYLLYAEVLNESAGPSAEVFKYIDSVRSRAGLRPVAEAWTNYSKNPSKYTTKEGLRNIIHQERLIELAFEGKRFWDIRRWKEAPRLMNQPVQGWKIDQQTALMYYRVQSIFTQTFQLKDYFWPVKESELVINKNLVQTYGW